MPVDYSVWNKNNGTPVKKIARPTVLSVLEEAISMGENRYARNLAISWLAVYPGDLQVNFTMARSLFLEGKVAQSIQILEKIVALDPEDIQAWKLLAEIYKKIDSNSMENALTYAFILGERVDASVPMPGWSIIFRNARRALLEGNFETAETYIYQGLALNQEHILGSVIHLKIIHSLGETTNLSKFSELYHLRWPACVLFKLGLAESQMEGGEESDAVNLLHQCVASDAAGEVSGRWWGENHSYRPLWPERLEIALNVPIPANIAEKLGWNRLAARADSQTAIPAQGLYDKDEKKRPSKPIISSKTKEQENIQNPIQEATQKTSQSTPMAAEKAIPDWVKATEKEFEKVARHLKQPGITSADGRYPIYVIFSTRSGLRTQYGDQTMGVLDKELQSLAETIKKRVGWGSLVFYPDDIETTGKLGMKTTATIDPWKLKLAINDLDTSLAKKGGRIGAMLIVGGSEVVPFHRLPNPTDDADEEVLSDNPYASLDSNYFVPEWPIGRLTGEKGSDAGLLLQQIRQAVRYHAQGTKKPKGIQSFSFIYALLQLLFKRDTTPSLGNAIGLTASVWRRSSLAAFRPVGEGKSLMVSPPVVSSQVDSQKVVTSQLGYFNLHGLAETGEWYGQRDPLELTSGPDYPVALSTGDLPKNGHSPRVVFSEACYGGYTLDKTEKTSMAMRFLSIGTSAVVASTGIAYGAASTPLVGADLFGYLFWSSLKEGYSIGDAFVKAKTELVNEMNKRQGYLDGEDQKTLISFVLYGDPLVTYDAKQVNSKQMLRIQQVANIKTICDNEYEVTNPQPINEKFIAQAKQAVSPYLPGLEQAEIQVSSQRVATEGKNHRKSGLGQRIGQKQIADRTLIIFKRKVQFGEHTHFNYARVTMNRDGKLMKMAFSK